MMIKQRFTALVALVVMLLSSTALPAMARSHYYRGYSNYYGGYRPYYSGYQRFSYYHPYVTKAAVGGGVGAIAGGLLAPEGRRGAGAAKGALIGAGIGLGYQYLRNRSYYGW